ncbi:MAG TPA: redoxin domain-containing protein [Gemmatimonadaceae bacterium]|nr:redoxin domain-containing protein [Gemmatimonadaceae bacterium]
MQSSRRAIRRLAAVAIAAASLSAAASLRAQDTTKVPNVGEMAPDFTAPGATRYGLLQSPVKLSDFRGKTVVLAFFFKARTKG